MTLSRKDKRFFRVLSWLVAALGCKAIYDGFTAILVKEFCYYSRGALFCGSGHTAQFQGGLVAIVGVLLLLLALPEARWRTISLWVMVFLFFFLLAGGAFVV